MTVGVSMLSYKPLVVIERNGCQFIYFAAKCGAFLACDTGVDWCVIFARINNGNLGVRRAVRDINGYTAHHRGCCALVAHVG